MNLGARLYAYTGVSSILDLYWQTEVDDCCRQRNLRSLGQQNVRLDGVRLLHRLAGVWSAGVQRL